MKKILVGLTVMALALMAAPALAVQPCQGPHCGGSNNGGLDISIDNDDTNVGNTVTVKADTGDNEIKTGKGFIKTGDATVIVSAANLVNYSDVFVKAPCNCLDDLKIDIKNDDTNVGNTVTVKADTGDNEIKGEKQGGFPFGFGFGGSSKGGKIITGDAGVQVDTLNDVNSSAIKVILKGISRVR
jgi:uncharacterized protein Veg